MSIRESNTFGTIVLSMDSAQLQSPASMCAPGPAVTYVGLSTRHALAHATPASFNAALLPLSPALDW